MSRKCLAASLIMYAIFMLLKCLAVTTAVVGCFGGIKSNMGHRLRVVQPPAAARQSKAVCSTYNHIQGLQAQRRLQ